MTGSMFDAEELGEGKYAAKFSVDKSGFILCTYTSHIMASQRVP
ncbi:MAG: hypothetical protein ACYDAJ_05610 [Nitrosotalea sp.]